MLLLFYLLRDLLLYKRLSIFNILGFRFYSFNWEMVNRLDYFEGFNIFVECGIMIL